MTYNEILHEALRVLFPLVWGSAEDISAMRMYADEDIAKAEAGLLRASYQIYNLVDKEYQLSSKDPNYTPDFIVTQIAREILGERTI